jgi:uroporphyrinogen-III synthase
MTTLLLTRPLADSTTLAQHLAPAGIHSILSPLITIRPHPVPHHPPALDGILLTSRHAVFAAQGSQLPCYVVGEQTAAAARAAGLVVAQVAPTAAALAPVLPPQAHLLHLSGAHIREDFRSAATITRQIVYEAEAATSLSAEATDALNQGGIDGAVFYSPRSARIFHQLLGATNLAPPPHAVAYCLSEAVAQHCPPAHWHRVVVAPAPTQDAMLQLLHSIK